MEKPFWPRAKNSIENIRKRVEFDLTMTLSSIFKTSMTNLRRVDETLLDIFLDFRDSCAV